MVGVPKAPQLFDTDDSGLSGAPASVARHGSKRNSAAVINTFRVFRIILTNAVKYVINVESYDRRIQSAINIQGKKMPRRAEFLLMFILRSNAQASYQVASTCPTNTSRLL